jgi:hypothetical protein
MIASTIAEAHKMIASDGLHNDEAHELIVSSAHNDRFNGSSMHVNDHAWMDDGDFSRNPLADSLRNPLRKRSADSDESAGNSLRDPLASSEESARKLLEEELYEIGFDRPGRWLQKENVSWELVSDWLAYVNDNRGIRNKAGFIRRQVEAGEVPNLRNVEQQQVPKEYEGIFLR